MLGKPDFTSPFFHQVTVCQQAVSESLDIQLNMFNSKDVHPEPLDKLNFDSNLTILFYYFKPQALLGQLLIPLFPISLIYSLNEGEHGMLTCQVLLF